MAEIASPISGGLKIARRTVSADSFVAAAPPPAASQPDQLTTSLIVRNSAGLTAVSNQLSSISQQVNALNAGMQNVYKNILTNTNLEKRQDQQENEQQRRLAEQQLREGQESIVERKMQVALVSPVQKTAAKTSSILSRLMGFFTTLLGGWLVNQGVDGIRKLAEGVKDRLEQVKNNVVKNFKFVGVVYNAIKTSLTSVFDIITGITNKVIKAVNADIFLNPVKSLVDGVKKIGGSIYDKIKDFLFPGKKEKEKEDAKPAPPVNSPTAGTPAPPATTTPGAGTPAPPATTTPGAGTPAPPAPPAPPATPAVSAPSADMVSKFEMAWKNRNKPMARGPIENAWKQMTPEQKQQAKEWARSQGHDWNEMKLKDPAETNAPQPMQSKIAPVAFGSNQNKDQKTEQPDLTKPPQYGTSTVQEISGTGMNQEFANPLSSAQIMPIKPDLTAKAGSVGPLPEPPANIIPITIPSAGGAARPQGSSQSGGSANSVPVIDPENPNNFYVMYAHSVYNVPMT